MVFYLEDSSFFVIFIRTVIHNMLMITFETRKCHSKKKLSCIVSGFDLMICDWYFTILVEVFTNHILAENIFHKSFRVNRTQDYGLKTSKQVKNYLTML